MSTTTETHYDLFCVAPDATSDELRTAYRRLMRTYHPDVAGAHGEAMTKRINAAWADLSDPGRRESYDSSIRPVVREEPVVDDVVEEDAVWTDVDAQVDGVVWADDVVETAEGKPYSPKKYRGWIIAWSLLTVALVAAIIVITVEWMNPSVQPNVFRFFTAVTTPVAAYVFFSRTGYRHLVGVILWLGALTYPLGLLGWWPFVGISEGFALSTLISTTAVPFLVYGSRVAWWMMRSTRRV